MDPVRVIWLYRSRSEPHVVVEFFRNRLRLEVGLARPVEFPCETSRSGDPDRQRPAQESAVNKLLEWFHRGSETVESVLEAEPGVKPEYPSVLMYRFDYLLTFPDGPRHRFFAEYILAGPGGFHRHESVPVRRSGDMDYVHVRVMDEVAPVAVGLEFLSELFLSLGQGVVEMVLVHITNGYQAAALVADEVEVAHSDTSHSDDSAGHPVARGDKSFVTVHRSQHVARQDGGRSHSKSSLLDEFSSGLCHIRICS